MEEERRGEERSCFTIKATLENNRVQLLSLSKTEFSYSVRVEKKCGLKKEMFKIYLDLNLNVDLWKSNIKANITKQSNFSQR